VLCTLVMDIQLYCQKYYFGRLAENYFSDLHQDVEEKLNVREGKNKKLLLVMPQTFDYPKLCEIGQLEIKYARVVANRWMQDGLIKRKKIGKSVIFERI